MTLFSRTRGMLEFELARMSRARITREFGDRNDVWREMVGCTQHWDAALETIVQPPEIVAAITEGYDGDVTLTGGAGTGKTFIEYALVREYLFSGSEPLLISAVDLAATETDDLISASVLFLDDVGAERNTPTNAEQLFRVVDRRWQRDAPTIISSNLTPDALRDHVGERIWDRLRGPMIVLSGASRRHHPIPYPDHLMINGHYLVDDVVAVVRSRIGTDDELWRRWCLHLAHNGLFELLDDRTTDCEAWHEPALVATVRTLLGPEAEDILIGPSESTAESAAPMA